MGVKGNIKVSNNCGRRALNRSKGVPKSPRQRFYTVLASQTLTKILQHYRLKLACGGVL